MPHRLGEADSGRNGNSFASPSHRLRMSQTVIKCASDPNIDPRLVAYNSSKSTDYEYAARGRGSTPIHTPLLQSARFPGFIGLPPQGFVDVVANYAASNLRAVDGP